MKAANEHMDAQGVPEDSLYRGLASITVACTIDPMLRTLMSEMYPGPQQILS